MRLASYTLLILGAVTVKVLAKPVQKLTLQQLDELAQKNGKIMVEWNVAACTYVGKKMGTIPYSFSPMVI